MNPWLFEIRNVAKSFGASNQVLRIDQLLIPSNSLVAVVGVTGSGKTTLFNLLGKLDDPDPPQDGRAPEIWVNLPAAFAPRLGKRLDLAATGNGTPAAQEFARSVSYVFQESYLLESASVKLNLSIASVSAGRPVSDAGIADVCNQARLTNVDLWQRAGTLSGGQKARLGFARALVRQPFLILADEVTSTLDPDTALDVVQVLKGWTGEGRSCLWITHDYRLALEADYVVALKEGRPTEAGAIPISRFGGDESKIRDLVRLPPAPTPPRVAVAAPPPGQSGGVVVDGLRLAKAEMFIPAVEADAHKDGIQLPLLRRYSQGPRTVLVFLLLLLATASYMTWAKIALHFREELDDPRLRHVVVEGNPIAGSWPISDASLRSLDGELATVSGAKAGEHVAFGRITGSGLIGFAYGKDGKLAVGKDGGAAFGAEGRVLRLDIDEPVTRAIMVKMRSGEEMSLRQAMMKYGTSPLPDGSQPIVILPEILSVLRDRNADRAIDFDPNQIMVKHKNWQAFTIVGEAKEQPRDRKALFDAVISLDQNREWMLQVDPESVSGEQSYERIAVYFDTGSYKSTQTFLENQKYIFDRGNLDKLVRLLDVSLGINASLLLLIAVVVSVTLASVVNIVRLYIQQNEKRLAVLAAHGSPSRLPVVNLVAQVTVAWAIAVPLVGALLALLVIITRSGFVNIDVLPDRPMLFNGLPVWAEAALPPITTLLMLVAATVFTFLRWQRKHGPLAYVLRKS
jgi:ABC-type lipoprotein export system ATPase subunit